MSTMLEGWGVKKRKITNQGSREVSKSLWVYPKVKDLLMQNISEYYRITMAFLNSSRYKI